LPRVVAVFTSKLKGYIVISFVSAETDFVQSLLFPLPGHPFCLHRTHFLVFLDPDQDMDCGEIKEATVSGSWN